MPSCWFVGLLINSVLLSVFWHRSNAAENSGPGAAKTKFGALFLCPPGGRTFQVAWSMACEMKKRKRSNEGKNEGKNDFKNHFKNHFKIISK